MHSDLQQLLAASALIITLERIASSGVLSHADERDARLLICRACRAFSIPSIAERPSNVIDLETATEALVRKEMERPL